MNFVTARIKNMCLLVIVMMIGLVSFAQNDNSIKGFVYEKSNGEPVMYSNVYLKGTAMGCTTDINGYFNITRIPDGTYTLMVTMMGYDTISEPVPF